MGFDKAAFIRAREYHPTEDQKLKAYRPTVTLGRHMTRCVPQPGDLLIDERGKIQEIK